VSAIVSRPDSRYLPEMIASAVADGDSDYLVTLNIEAETMAFWPSTTPGLNDEWKAAYTLVNDALLTVARNRKRR
jgi:hypothetical protein